MHRYHTVCLFVLFLAATLSAQGTSRNLTVPTTSSSAAPSSASGGAPPSASGNATTPAGNTTTGGNTTTTGNSTSGARGNTTQPSTTVPITTTLAGSSGATGTNVPNPFNTGSAGGSRNPDDGYIAAADRVRALTPWIGAGAVGMLGLMVLL